MEGEGPVCGGGASVFVEAELLCVDLCGGSFLVDGLPPQVVAAFILLLHPVDEEESEEHR